MEGDKGNSDDDRKPSAQEKANLESKGKRRQTEDEGGEKPRKRRARPSTEEGSIGSEEAAVPGETKRERRRRLNRASAKKKRAMKMVELEYMQEEQQRLSEANQSLRTDNDNLRERISMIKRYLPQNTSQAASVAAAAAPAPPSTAPTDSARLPSASAPLPRTSPPTSAATALGAAFPTSPVYAVNQGAGTVSGDSHTSQQMSDTLSSRIPQHLSAFHPSVPNNNPNTSHVHQQNLLDEPNITERLLQLPPHEQSHQNASRDEEKTQAAVEPLLDIFRQQRQLAGRSRHQSQLTHLSGMPRRDQGEEKQALEPLLDMLRQRQEVPLAHATDSTFQLQDHRGISHEPLLDMLRQQQAGGIQNQTQAAAQPPDHRSMAEYDLGSISVEAIAEIRRANQNPEAGNPEGRLHSFFQGGLGGDRSLPPTSSLAETFQLQLQQQNLQQQLLRDVSRLGMAQPRQFLPQNAGFNMAQVPPSLSQSTSGANSGGLSGISQRQRMLLEAFQYSQQQPPGLQRQVPGSHHSHRQQQQQSSFFQQQHQPHAEMHQLPELYQQYSQPQVQADQLREVLMSQQQGGQISLQAQLSLLQSRSHQPQFQPQMQQAQSQDGQMQQLLSLMAARQSLTNPPPHIQPQIPAVAASNTSNLASSLSSLVPGQGQRINLGQHSDDRTTTRGDSRTISDILRLLNRGGNPPPPPPPYG